MEGNGYGIYSGVGGLPYQVGQQPGGYSPSPREEIQPDSSGAMPRPKPTQAQSAPGAAGSQSYMSGLPQWMQDYFDAQYGQNLGMFAENQQRHLAVNTLPGLQQRYGANAAANPYFLQHGAIAKGFDPFNNALYTTEDAGEENPGLQKYLKTQRDPFSGYGLAQELEYRPKEIQHHGPEPSQYNAFGRFMLGK